MSARDPNTARALERLRAQLEALAHVRHADPREPAFRAWRVATVTALQRTWPGEHAIVWDGRNESGQAAGGGVYFCQVRVGGRNATQKLLVIQ